MDLKPIMSKLDKVENRVIALETEFQMIKKIIWTAVAGIGATLGINLVG
jgi:hypothetical protein